ncbi:MAG TPA: hypothetical protein VK154_15895, partial [Chitinophagales bacterium]|nr:hypothetical protein [Chitinophagales bacterium]
MKKRILPLVVVLHLCIMHVTAQSTYDQVYTILQTKCTGYCHGSAHVSGLNFTGTSSEVYNRLVNVAPVNTTASAAGLKLVSPGNPYLSLLMKKVSHGLDPKNSLAAGMGNTMPDNSDTLSKAQIETVRQWIVWGAKDTGTTHNANLIADYYTNGGIEEMAAPLTPAEEG